MDFVYPTSSRSLSCPARSSHSLLPGVDFAADLITGFTDGLRHDNGYIYHCTVNGSEGFQHPTPAALTRDRLGS